MADLFTEVYNLLPLSHLINKNVLVRLIFITCFFMILINFSQSLKCEDTPLLCSILQDFYGIFSGGNFFFLLL